LASVETLQCKPDTIVVRSITSHLALVCHVRTK
jgi:hypothetical protein